MSDFPNLRKAMAEYDRTEPEREAILAKIDRARSQATILALLEQYEKLEAAAAEKLQLAFYEDTKAFNGREDCRRIPVKKLKRMLEKSSHEEPANG